MPETERITLTLRTDQFDLLEDLAENDDPRWRSKSEVARHLLDEAQRVDDLEQELERLKNEKQVFIDEYQEDEPDEIEVREDDDSSFVGRLKWLFTGK